MLRAAHAAIVREVRDSWRLATGLVLAFALLAFSLGSSRHALPALSFGAASVPFFALAWLPASVVDDGSSGLARLIGTQPLPAGAYGLLRIASASALLLLLVVPALVCIALATATVVQLPRALVAAAFSTLWAASAAVLLGLRTKGPAAASALWIVLALANLLAVLRVWSDLYVDWLVRGMHWLPGPAAAESVATAADPWRLGALSLLIAQSLLFLLAAWAASAGSTRFRVVGLLAALTLPFAAPAVGA